MRSPLCYLLFAFFSLGLLTLPFSPSSPLSFLHLFIVRWHCVLIYWVKYLCYLFLPSLDALVVLFNLLINYIFPDILFDLHVD